MAPTGLTKSELYLYYSTILQIDHKKGYMGKFFNSKILNGLCTLGTIIITDAKSVYSNLNDSAQKTCSDQPGILHNNSF